MSKILHSNNGYYVDKQSVNYCVWIPRLHYAEFCSAYSSLEMAIARCDYLAKTHHDPERFKINKYHHDDITN
jgi:hypothetical protein